MTRATPEQQQRAARAACGPPDNDELWPAESAS
jgi:hypothetical protein